MSRFKVVRGVIAYRGKKYSEGTFLPENFTEKERHHCAFPHRIVEVPDDEIPVDKPIQPQAVSGAVVQAAPRAEVRVAAKATIPPQNTSKGASKADVHPASLNNTSGTLVTSLR